MVASRGEGDVTVVSNLTGRCREVESNYLKSAARMGWLHKGRVLKAICFRPVSRRDGERVSTVKIKALKGD